MLSFAVSDARVPASLDAISPEWLTGALRDRGVLGPNAGVRAVRRRVVGEGSGFIGLVARLELDYEGDAGAAPRACIAKLPSPDPGSRQIGLLYGLYEREVHFYTDLATRVGVATPACHFAAYDADAGQSLILLEELVGGRWGDQVAGCDAADARLAVGQLARLQARWWEAPALVAIPWMARGPDLLRGAMMVYEACWDQCVTRFGHVLSPEILAVGPAVGRRLLAALDLMPVHPLTLVHGDYRLDNLFFPGAGARPRLTVCDWQSPNCGWGSYDLTYFITTSLPTEARRALEPELCDLYHRELGAAGVRGYARDELDRDYRLNLAAMFGISVINGATLPTVNERATLIWERTLARLVDAIADLDALAALPD